MPVTGWRSGCERNGHDVVEVSGLGPDPGDEAILEMAAREARILVTIDTDFGRLVQGGADHAGLIRLPDVPAGPRIHLLAEVLLRHADDVAAGAVLTVKKVGGSGSRKQGTTT